MELLLGRSTALIFTCIKKKTFQVWVPKTHNEELKVSWYVFWGWSSKHQLQAESISGLAAFERGPGSSMNCIGLCASDESVRTRFICHVKRLHTVSAGPLFRSYWPRWKPLELVVTQSCSKSLHKTLQNWQNINQNPCPQSFPPHLCSVPSQNRDKTIMTQLATSIMSENEIDLKTYAGPGWNRRDYCADCTNTVSLTYPSIPL